MVSFVPLLFAITTGLAAAQTCDRGSFASDGVCKLCPLGTTQSEPGSTSCDKCPAGTFRPFDGGFFFDQCLKCPAGFTSEEGASSCKPCPENSFSRPGWSRCVPRCKPGHGFADFDEEYCKPCPPSKFNDGSTFECRRCPSGTAATMPGSARCTPCAPGTFRDMRFVSRIDVAKCFKCPVNTYADRSGTRQCKLCPPGTVASPGSTRCTSCKAGTFRFGLRYTKCMPCPEGTSSLGRRPAHCRHPQKGCPFGTFMADGECRACRPGERLDVARRVCVPCAHGRVSRGGAATQCEACAPEEEPEDDISIFEGSQCRCRAGWGRDESGKCARCPETQASLHRPAGAIWNSNWRVSHPVTAFCMRCTSGQPLDNGSRCGFCPIGTVSTPDGLGCTTCPNGTRPDAEETLIAQEYEDEERDPHERGCTRLVDRCQAGSFQVRSGDQLGTCRPFVCPPHAKLGAFGNECVTCGPFERFDPDDKSCKDCPDGTGANPLKHARETCSTCGPNALTSYQEGGCRCKTGFVRQNGACVACPSGTVSTYQGCVRCKTGVWTLRTDGVGECKKCPGALVFRDDGAARCVPCRDGFTRAYDVLGEATEVCMPVGRYFPVGFEGNRFA